VIAVQPVTAANDDAVADEESGALRLASCVIAPGFS
jgi:hypothetical protein